MSLAAARPCVLVFDPEHEGHRSDYVRLLLERLASEALDLELLLAVPEPLLERVRDEVSADAQARLRPLPLPPEESRRCASAPLWRRGFLAWNLLQGVSGAAGVGAAYALHLDPLLAPLAFGLRGRVRLGGILFRPSIHYRRAGLDAGASPAWHRKLLKAGVLRRAIANPALRRVSSLDEPFVDSAGDVLPSAAVRVSHLPEPLPSDPCRGETAGWIAALPRGRIRLVLPGVLAERKGVFVMIDALARLTDAEARRLTVVFAGATMEADRARFAARLGALGRAVPGLHVHLEDRFLTAAELDQLLAAADVVLLPYQRFVGSSGLLYRAARAGRPVLAPSYGLLGWLVRSNGLGLDVDTTDPASLAGAVRRCLAGPDEISEAGRLAGFAAGAGDAAFAGALLADVAGLASDL